MDQQIIADAAFKVAERWLYNLPSWRAEMVAIETSLEDPSGKITVSYGGIGAVSGGGMEDGLFGAANELVNDEARLVKLKSRVKVIDAAIDALGYDERLFINLKYIDKRPVKVICDKMVIDEQIYKRRRRKAVREILKTLLKFQAFLFDVNQKIAK